MKKILSLVVLLILPVSTALAISEKNYEAEYKSKVIPYYNSSTSGNFKGEGGRTIRYRLFDAPGAKATIVIVSGRAESFLKYAEVAYDLSLQGFSVYSMDNRGQGFSDRMLKDSQIGYVKDFDDYVKDFTTFVNTVVIPRTPGKKYLLAHSMGGPIATLYMSQNPHVFQAAVLSAPGFQANTGKYSQSVAYAIVASMSFFGKGGSYAIGGGPYNWEAKFEGNDTTNCKVRYDKWKQLVKQNPHIALAGPSNRWVQQFLAVSGKIQKVAPSFTVPVTLFQAGKDQLVLPGRQDSFCQLAAKCEKVVFPTAQHEIFMEVDSVRDAALTQTVKFFNAH